MSTTRPNRPTTPARTPARVAFVGAGPGDAGLMTVRALEYLAEADAVVIDQVASLSDVRAMALHRDWS